LERLFCADEEAFGQEESLHVTVEQQGLAIGSYISKLSKSFPGSRFLFSSEKFAILSKMLLNYDTQ
jgi:hypothetical protein